jgi:hypothetical protein
MSLDKVTDVDFSVLQEYINTGSSKSLSEDHKRMLDICLRCYGLLRDFPQRNVCIRKLMALMKLPYSTAARYVDFTRQTWGDYLRFKRDFLETFFVERLMYEITKPNASESVRSKNLATLQKYLESMPDNNIDPHLTESNNVYIQVNLNNKTFNLPEKALAALPQEIRQQILAAIDDNIDDEGAVALLEN